jgi:hypothetical protein
LLFDLLFKIYSKKDIFKDLSENIDSVPDKLRNELLVKLAEDPSLALDISCVVSSNFNKLPENIRNELQGRLAKHGYKIG